MKKISLVSLLFLLFISFSGQSQEDFSISTYEVNYTDGRVIKESGHVTLLLSKKIFVLEKGIGTDHHVTEYFGISTILKSVANGNLVYRFWVKTSTGNIPCTIIMPLDKDRTNIFIYKTLIWGNKSEVKNGYSNSNIDIIEESRRD